MNKRSIITNHVLGILLTILFIFAAETRAAPNGKIAFVSNRDGNDEIHVMNADGSNQTQLTNNPLGDGDVEPAFSPDGAKITFTSHRNGNDNTEIYVMNADGSNQIRLTNNAGHDFQPTWSPDGRKIAYIREFDKINVMNADGSGQTTIYQTEYLYALAWSPDGTKIAFAAFDGSGVEAINIFVINVATGNVARLTQATFFEYNHSPAWSPDGARIAFSRAYYDFFTDTETDTLNMMNADGSNNQPLFNTNPFFSRNLSWSPDGAKIAFELQGNNKPGDIYTINSNGSGLVNLTNSPGADYDPSWGPVPSASVSVGGRVTTPDGRGLRNAIVSITDSLGLKRTVTTSSFGYYTFDNVRTGETYEMSVNSRLYRFAPRNVTADDNLAGVDFVGLE